MSRADGLRGAWLRKRLQPARVFVYARLGSTQQWAAREVEAGRLKAPALIAASRQTAGRGQRANRWWSDAGSLCATMVLPASDCLVGQVPLRAGLAVAEVLARRLSGKRVELKWPNDVLVEGLKIAGVLCRRLRGRDVIGIGLNVRTCLRRMPPDVRRAATSLHRYLARAPRRDALLVEVWHELQRQLARPDIEIAFAQRDAMRDKPVRVRIGADLKQGRCRGIDAEGRLRVELAGIVVRVTDSEQIDY